MKEIWIINQFANTSDMPGHTRQYDLAVFLNNNGYKPTVFSSDFNLSKRKFLKGNKKFFYKSEFINSIKWVWLGVFPYRKNDWKRYLNLLSFCLNLSFQLFIRLIFCSINKRSPKLIISSSPQLPASFISLLISKLFKIPMIFEVRDLWPQILIEMNNMKAESITYKVLKKMESVLYRNSDLIVVLSKGCINYVKKNGARRVEFLPNSANTDLFNFSKLPAEGEKFSSERPFRIIYSGAHGIANDLENVIKAAFFLKNLPIKIILVGDGPQKDHLKILASTLENIDFKDPISKKDVPELLSNADAILISLADIKLFEYGVSPNKLFDAYAVGRPVITTIKGIVNNEVEKFNLGVTSPPGNPMKLSKAIKKLFKKERSERIKISINCRKMVDNFYSKDLIMTNYLDKIRTLTN